MSTPPCSAALCPRFHELAIDEVTFLPFVRTVFAQKRKTLANNLRAAQIAPAIVTAALARAAIDPQARAESLPLMRWLHCGTHCKSYPLSEPILRYNFRSSSE